MKACRHQAEIRSIETEAADMERDGILDMHTEDAMTDEIEGLEHQCFDECPRAPGPVSDPRAR